MKWTLWYSGQTRYLRAWIFISSSWCLIQQYIYIYIYTCILVSFWILWCRSAQLGYLVCGHTCNDITNLLSAVACYPKGCAAPGFVPCQCNTRGPLSKLERTPPQIKINVTSKSPVGDISVVTLIRTDTTLDHSQKAEKVWKQRYINDECHFYDIHHVVLQPRWPK